MKLKTLLLLTGLVVMGVSGLRAAELPVLKHKFVVIAHRGNHINAHENTVTAIEHAIQCRADFAEIDARQTKDGVFVLMHDSTVDRMTDGKGRVKDFNFADIPKLKVVGRTRPSSIPANRVPTFEEILDAARGKIHLYVDFKEGDRAKAAALIRSHGMARGVIIYDDLEAMADWKKIAPEFPVIASAPKSGMTAPALLEVVTKTKVEILDGDWTDYTREVVLAMQKSGIVMWPDIQGGAENEARWEKVVAMGFKGAQTDHPAQFISWLEKKGLR